MTMPEGSRKTQEAALGTEQSRNFARCATGVDATGDAAARLDARASYPDRQPQSRPRSSVPLKRPPA